MTSAHVLVALTAIIGPLAVLGIARRHSRDGPALAAAVVYTALLIELGIVLMLKSGGVWK